MSYFNDVQECYMTVNKRKTNSVLNKNQCKNCIFVITTEPDFQHKT